MDYFAIRLSKDKVGYAIDAVRNCFPKLSWEFARDIALSQEHYADLDDVLLDFQLSCNPRIFNDYLAAERAFHASNGYNFVPERTIQLGLSKKGFKIDVLDVDLPFSSGLNYRYKAAGYMMELIEQYLDMQKLGRLDTMSIVDSLGALKHGEDIGELILKLVISSSERGMSIGPIYDVAVSFTSIDLANTILTNGFDVALAYGDFRERNLTLVGKPPVVDSNKPIFALVGKIDDDSYELVAGFGFGAGLTQDELSRRYTSHTLDIMKESSTQLMEFLRELFTNNRVRLHRRKEDL
ncbi:MAG: hypothetical protein ABIJ08_02155 [Nanoarchaeota archaeon]